MPPMTTRSIWRKLLIAPILGGLFVVFLPAVGLLLPLMALVDWAINECVKFGDA